MNDVFSRCQEASIEAQGKPDDIQVLEKKLRSLFMDLGGGVSSTPGEMLATDPTSGASAGGTSSPLATCSTSTTSVTTPGSSQAVNPPQPPSSLALGSLGSPTPAQGSGTPISAPPQTGGSETDRYSACTSSYLMLHNDLCICFSTVIAASSFGQTTPSKTPLSRVPVSCFLSKVFL